MNGVINFFCSTVGRKQLVGITGLGLTGFVVGHVTGNFLMFVGPEAYNRYGHGLTSSPLIYVVEMGLIALFSLHLVIALKLQLQNHFARPVKYAVSAGGEKGTSSVTKTMWMQGIVIAVFAVLHLITFKFGPNELDGYRVTYGGVEMRDLFRLVVEVFQSPAYVGWYIFSLIVLGFHLSHGVASSFQTLGFNHPKYNETVKWLGRIVAAYVSLGFISQPIYMFFFYKG